MDYLSLVEDLRKNDAIIFSLHDAESFFPGTAGKTVKNDLSNWVRRGLVRRLRRGLYELAVPGKEIALPEYYVANRLYAPSYVSLEAALSFYGIVPEEAAQVTCVSARPTRIFRNRYGTFVYRTCKKEAFTGYGIMKMGGYKALVADREKALVDYVYFSLRGGSCSFDRLDPSGLNGNKALRYARLFNERTFEKVAELIGR
jgi:predicted transcriptional regulator of viral defense system